jgi:hypothetical protein
MSTSYIAENKVSVLHVITTPGEYCLKVIFSIHSKCLFIY